MGNLTLILSLVSLQALVSDEIKYLSSDSLIFSSSKIAFIAEM